MASSVVNSVVCCPSGDALTLALECSSLKDLASLSQVNQHFRAVVNIYVDRKLRCLRSVYHHWIEMHPGKIDAFKGEPESSSLGVIYHMYKLLIKQKGRIVQLRAKGESIEKVENPLDFPLRLEIFQKVYNENRVHRRDQYLNKIQFELGLKNKLYNQLMNKFKGDKEKFLKRSFIHIKLSLLLKSALCTNYWEPIPALVKTGIRYPDFQRLKKVAIDKKDDRLEWIQVYELSVSQEARFSRYKEILISDLGEKRVDRAIKTAEGSKKEFTNHLLAEKINPSVLLEASAAADYWEPVSGLVEVGARLSPPVEGEPQTLTQKWTGNYRRAVKKQSVRPLCSID